MSTDHRYDVVALGEPLIEFNQVRGGDAHVWRQGFGGDTSNMAIAAARLGARVAYVTRLGDDGFGRQFRALWSAEGVALDGVATDPEAPTGVYFVTHGPSGHAFAYLRAGSAASRLAPSNLPLDVIRASRALHVSGISQAISTSACDAVFAAIAAAREAGARIYYDLNLRPKLWPLARARAVALATIGQSDWCLPSREDAEWVFGTSDPDAVIDACRRAGARGVVYKRGADGCVVDDGRTRAALGPHRRDRRRRLFRRGVRGAARGGRRPGRSGALRERGRGDRDDRLRRGRAAAAATRRRVARPAGRVSGR